MLLSLAQAAKTAGRSRQALQAAIKKGTLSASKNAFGQWEVDAAEVERVYTLSRPKSANDSQDLRPLAAEKEARFRELKARLEALEELKGRIEQECEGLKEDKAKAERREADLRRDLDQWRGFAFDAQQRLKALEAPKQEPMHEGRVIEADAREPIQKKGFFRRLGDKFRGAA